MKTLSRSLFWSAHGIACVAFFWPFLGLQRSHLSILSQTWIAIFIATLALAIVATRISAQLLDSKAIAIVAVMTGFIASLRLVGAGAVGIEPMWFLLIVVARALGAQLGFAIGVLSMGASAIITGGVGPWLAFQMFAAGWIAVGVSLIPDRIRGNFEVLLIALYGSVASLIFGVLMDLQLWPWLTGIDSQLSLNADLDWAANLQRFLIFHFATSMAWDLPRAILTFCLVLVAGRSVLFSLRRAEQKLGFHSSSTSHATEQRVPS